MSAAGRRRKPRGTAGAEGPLPARVHSVPVTRPDSLVPEETLAEAEDELGQNDWIDPDTGELADGEAPPRLGEE